MSRQLDPAAVAAANKALFATHPELLGRVLTSGPEDAALRKEWLGAYGKAAKKLVPPRPKVVPKRAIVLQSPPSGVVQKCPFVTSGVTVGTPPVASRPKLDRAVFIPGNGFDLWSNNKLDNWQAAGAALQYAYLADAAYAKAYSVDTPNGVWNRALSLREILFAGLAGRWTPDAIEKYASEIESSGFSATLYEHDGRYVLAYRGTQGLPDIKGWQTDLSQRFGGTSSGNQYQYAAFIAALAMRKAGPNIVLTGHSLGGGLAQYASYSLSSHPKTVTFNAAGLGSEVARYTSISNIVNVRIDGDPVSANGLQLGKNQYTIANPDSNYYGAPSWIAAHTGAGSGDGTSNIIINALNISWQDGAYDKYIKNNPN